MKQVLLSACLFAAALLLAACSDSGDEPAKTASASAPGSDDAWLYHYAVQRDIPYGDDPQQRFDIYAQGDWVGEPTFFQRAPEPRPTLLFIHGGGWMARDRGPEVWVLPFIREGWHVFTITYRLGSGAAPLAVDDAMCALNLIASNAEAFGVDRDRIVVAGASAGGHLSLTTGILGSRPGHECYPGDDFRVRAVINWFGITDIRAIEEHLARLKPAYGNFALQWIGDRSRVAEISAGYSPVNLVDATTPPVLTIHGMEDTVVPYSQAVALQAKLDELGIRNTLLSLAGSNHAGFSDAQFEEAFAKMLEFVDE